MVLLALPLFSVLLPRAGDLAQLTQMPFWIVAPPWFLPLVWALAVNAVLANFLMTAAATAPPRPALQRITRRLGVVCACAMFLAAYLTWGVWTPLVAGVAFEEWLYRIGEGFVASHRLAESNFLPFLPSGFGSSHGRHLPPRFEVPIEAAGFAVSSALFVLCAPLIAPCSNRRIAIGHALAVLLMSGATFGSQHSIRAYVYLTANLATALGAAILILWLWPAEERRSRGIETYVGAVGFLPLVASVLLAVLPGVGNFREIVVTDLVFVLVAEAVAVFALIVAARKLRGRPKHEAPGSVPVFLLLIATVAAANEGTRYIIGLNDWSFNYTLMTDYWIGNLPAAGVAVKWLCAVTIHAMLFAVSAAVPCAVAGFILQKAGASFRWPTIVTTSLLTVATAELARRLFVGSFRVWWGEALVQAAAFTVMFFLASRSGRPQAIALNHPFTGGPVQS
jgi:hypothetical protein